MTRHWNRNIILSEKKLSPIETGRAPFLDLHLTPLTDFSGLMNRSLKITHPLYEKKYGSRRLWDLENGVFVQETRSWRVLYEYNKTGRSLFFGHLVWPNRLWFKTMVNAVVLMRCAIIYAVFTHMLSSNRSGRLELYSLQKLGSFEREKIYSFHFGCTDR